MSLTGFGRVFLWGDHPKAVSYNHVSWLFLRILALIYLIAFVSLWVQLEGLIGDRGILPVGDYLNAISTQMGGERFFLLPTLSWFMPDGLGLHLLCACGCFCSILLLANIFSGPCLFLNWACYLSLAGSAQVFLGFQWDNLLLEAGFLAMFLAPWRFKPRDSGTPSIIIIWLYRLLLFRLMFCSGMAKILSGDLTWENLTALTVHYQTQPLPTWIGWMAHQMPESFHRWSAGGMFLIELAVPFLIFLPRRPRALAFFLFFGLMVLIIMTGNYTFFNWLTMAISMFLLDDEMFDAALPKSLRPEKSDSGKLALWRWVVHGGVAVLIILVSASQMATMFGTSPAPIKALERAVSPFRSVNSYGLFAVMTQKRYEIVFEGSGDGKTWLPYEFKFKPDKLSKRPAFVAPHQPRLDWQMWFAALGDFNQSPWLQPLMKGLQEGNPHILDLMGKNPFQKQPPRYLRAMLYQYHFTNWETRANTGQWWRRQVPVAYGPVLDGNPLQE